MLIVCGLGNGHSGQTALRLLGPRHKHVFWLVIGGYLSVCYGLAPHNQEEAAINLSRADWSIELSRKFSKSFHNKGYSYYVTTNSK